MKRILAALLALLLAAPANAATLAIRDGNGAGQTMGEGSDTAGNLYPIQLIGNINGGVAQTAPVSPTLGLSVNVTGLIGQGSTTTSQTGLLGMGAVTTASPSYTNGQSSPFSLDTSGNLRVNVVAGGASGGTSSSFSAAFPSIGTAIGVKNGSNMVNLTADGSNNLNINCAVGCGSGSFNNNADAVATSSTNQQAASWLYAFNGTTFDRLRDDASKNLMVNVNAALPAGSATIGAVTQASGPWTQNLTQVAGSSIATGAGSSTGAIRVEVANNGAGLIGLNAGTNSIGAVTVSQTVTNPSSTLTLPSTTTAYTAGQLIANSATAGSVVNPSFAIATSGGGAMILRLRLSTNDSTSTAWANQTVRVDLWTTTPTWTNGDRGTWSPATGTGAHLGAYTCPIGGEFGDGAYAECQPAVGNFALPKLASGTSIFWSLFAVTGSGVTGASKVFTLVAELLN